jgi:hypothetical protein
MMHILKVNFKTRELLKVVEDKSELDDQEQCQENIVALFLDAMKAALSHKEYLMVLEALSSIAHHRNLVGAPHLNAWVEAYFKLISET